MALFGRKKSSDEEESAQETADGQAPEVDAAEESYSPKKAAVFFDRAKSVHDATNYEYAMQLWLSGLRQDPTSMDGLKGFLRAGQAFAEETGKKTVSKEVVRAVTSKGGVNRYIQALVGYGVRQTDGPAALKVAEAASGLGLHVSATYMGRAALALALQDKKQKKDTFVRLLEIFEAAGAYQEAVQAGSIATRLDQSDGQLQRRVSNMMAQATMTSGGFDETGEEGGFRRNIRDAEKQRQLEEQERIVKTDETRDRLLATAEEEYRAKPEDPVVIDRYGKALLERGRPADELRAMSLYSEAYNATKQFRFRQRAGEIAVRRAQRNVKAARAAAEANPADEAAKDKYERMLAELRRKELEELQLQVENYPTDLPLKFRLGKTFFDAGEYNESIALFQQAQDDAKNRRTVLKYMAEAFRRLGGWEEEAIQTYRQALDGYAETGSDLGLELRYGLMCALQDKARQQRDLEAAEEADKLAAGIAIQKFGYRDIRERREAIKAIVSELRG